MARTRTLAQQADDVYKLCDIETDTARFPLAEIYRHVNQGNAELYDLLVSARGRAYFQTSYTVTTVNQVTNYALPSQFYALTGVWNRNGCALEPFQPIQEAELRDPNQTSGSFPRYYQLRAGSIELLPAPAAGYLVDINLVPLYEDLVNGTDAFDGINGWEEYTTFFAGKRVFIKNEEIELVAVCDGEMARLRERIAKLAPNRDRFRAERVQDVRSARARSRWPR